MKRSLIALSACILLLGASAPTPVSETHLVQQMYSAATRQRAQYGRSEQVLDESLCRIAQNWANHMAARNMMYHGGGEQVIAQGYSSPDACIRGWIASPGHRVWVLGGNARCGFGVARSSSGRLFYAGVYR